jgi:ABC-type proline/glycine betaine transport system ATPase subunit
MLDEMQLESEIRELILDLCSVLYKYGYQQVSVGAMMRLVGVESDRAMKHDDMILLLDESFQAYLEMREPIDRAPPGSTFH